MKKHNRSISMIEKYWTRSQSETIALVRWFQSGHQNSSGSLLVCEKRLNLAVGRSILLNDFPYAATGEKKERVYKVINKLCVHKNVLVLLFIILAEKNIGPREMSTEDNKQEKRWWHERDKQSVMDRVIKEGYERQRWVLVDCKEKTIWHLLWMGI